MLYAYRPVITPLPPTEMYPELAGLESQLTRLEVALNVSQWLGYYTHKIMWCMYIILPVNCSSIHVHVYPGSQWYDTRAYVASGN